MLSVGTAPGFVRLAFSRQRPVEPRDILRNVFEKCMMHCGCSEGRLPALFNSLTSNSISLCQRAQHILQAATASVQLLPHQFGPDYSPPPQPCPGHSSAHSQPPTPQCSGEPKPRPPGAGAGGGVLSQLTELKARRRPSSAATASTSDAPPLSGPIASGWPVAAVEPPMPRRRAAVLACRRTVLPRPPATPPAGPAAATAAAAPPRSTVVSAKAMRMRSSDTA